jgi:predicted DsbA family dithiol-disulfide isomerase
MTNNLPELKITVFSDYICPFCYVGHHRLMRLQDTYDLKINWCFIEIHPENSPEGEPTTSLDYPSEQWNLLMQGLKKVAAEEGIPIAEHTFTTNSKDAILLSEYCKTLGRELFYKLHESLFNAFFVDEKNIGDREVLKDIANKCGIDDETINNAWQDKTSKQTILRSFDQARKYEIQSVPSFIFGERVLTGVVEESTMRSAAEELLNQ